MSMYLYMLRTNGFTTVQVKPKTALTELLSAGKWQYSHRMKHCNCSLL